MLGRIAIFAAGTLVGGVIGYAASKSDTVEKTTKCTIKAGLKAKDWTVKKYSKAKDNLTSMVKEAKEEQAAEPVKA